MRNLYLLIPIILCWTVCINANSSNIDSLVNGITPSTINVPYNRANVIATIERINARDSNKCKIVIKIITVVSSIGIVSFIKAQDIITVIPFIAKDSTGHVFDSINGNKELQTLLKKKRGSKIKATLYFQGSEYGSNWYLMSYESINK